MKTISVVQMDGTKTQLEGTTFTYTPDHLLHIYDGEDLIAMFTHVKSVRIGSVAQDPDLAAHLAAPQIAHVERTPVSELPTGRRGEPSDE